MIKWVRKEYCSALKEDRAILRTVADGLEDAFIHEISQTVEQKTAIGRIDTSYIRGIADTLQNGSKLMSIADFIDELSSSNNSDIECFTRSEDIGPYNNAQEQ